jgi:hypothetical protein
MNTTLGKRIAPGATIARQNVAVLPTTHPRLVDRLAMRIGLALLLWGQRGRVAPSAVEVRRARLAAAAAEQERERHRSRPPLMF